MSECMDTMPAPGQLRAGPLEGFTTWLFAGLLRLARFGDRVVVESVTSALDWHQRARQRAALRSLNDRMLRDIGLSTADVHRECVKPFWMQ